MRIAVAALLVSMVAVMCTGEGSPGRVGASTAPGSRPVDVPVTRVTDGDTFHVRYGGHDERVRLIGVDTPEVPWYGGLGECYGEEAGRYSRSRLVGRTIRLEFDVDQRDRYQRLLAYVFVGDELFNLTLVQLGYATADPVPPDTARARDFAAAEGEARAARRGLWSACPAPSP
jgi:micrococcal nuclease